MTSLRFVLRLNAASCLGFGALFVIVPDAVAGMLGTAPPVVVFGLGIMLLANAGHLALASMRARPHPAEVTWFALGDMAWWLASMGLIAAGVWVTSAPGIALALLVAAGVAGLGTAQLFLLGREMSGLTASGHWRRIGRSWLSLPGWVKAWLFLLNAVFLAAPAFVPWGAASVVLIGYVASGPLLLGFAVHAGGLTRAMGIGHLLPWGPLLVWLALQAGMFDGLLMQTRPVQFAYVWLLGVTVTACLAFDLYDLARWLRGDRAILLISAGSGNASAPAICPKLGS